MRRGRLSTLLAAVLLVLGLATLAAGQAKARLAPLVPDVNYYGAQVPSAYLEQPLVAQVAGGAAALERSNGRGVVVALIDNGVDPFNPVLRSSLLGAEGWNFYTHSANWSAWNGITAALLHGDAAACPAPRGHAGSVSLNGSVMPMAISEDDATQAVQLMSNVLRCDPAFGHGTAVAGLIHLIAPEARILPLTAFGPNGATSASAIAQAIRYAVAHHANIINLSFSAQVLAPEVESALAEAMRHGVVIVAAAGNDGRSAAVFPASLPGVIGVGAINGCAAASGPCTATALLNRALFSNFDPPEGILNADVAAPGVRLVTTFPGFGLVWATASGTSFSAALVSGEAALLAGTGLSSAQIANAMEASADPAIPGDADGGLGHGLIQILGALKQR